MELVKFDGHKVKEGHTDIRVMYLSGSNGPHHQNEQVSKCVVYVIPVLERAKMVQILTSIGKLNVIQAYAPTADKEDHETGNFSS